jgi:hypothetical protein
MDAGSTSLALGGGMYILHQPIIRTDPPSKMQAKWDETVAIDLHPVVSPNADACIGTAPLGRVEDIEKSERRGARSI